MSFPASYSGTCDGCGEHFSAGTEVGYVDGALVVDECCGTPGLPYVRPVAADPVMPRGKTRRDVCPNGCFQIPSSNGVCGCP